MHPAGLFLTYCLDAARVSSLMDLTSQNVGIHPLEVLIRYQVYSWVQRLRRKDVASELFKLMNIDKNVAVVYDNRPK